MSESDRPARTGRPPGPRGLPFIGHLHRLSRGPLEFWTELATHESDVVAYSILGNEGQMVLHPTDIEQVLVEDAPKYHRGQVVSDNIGAFAGNSLLTTEGDQWRTQRRAIQPMFTMDRLRQYAPTMVAYADRTVQEWEDGEVVELDAAMRQLTLDILGRTLFDRDIRGQETAVAELAEATIHRFDTDSLTWWAPAWAPTPRNLRLRRAVAEAESRMESLIGEREREHGGTDDLLSRMVAAEGLSAEEIKDNLLAFVFAGHETTALTLTYACYLLATNPSTAARLRTEVDAVLEGRTPEMADLEDLAYTEWVVKEALRLYPPAFVNFREPTEDVVVGGYETPAGTIIVIPTYVVHRDDRWYDDPDTFRPERWRADKASERPEYAYLPFGGGPRHCIGMRFAMLEAQLVLATIASQVTMEDAADSPLEVTTSVTLQPETSVPMRINRR